MDDSKFEKIRLLVSIVIATFCYGMFFYLLYGSLTRHQNILGPLLFLVIAINNTYRIRAHYKIERMRKDAVSEEEVAEAARRQGLVSSIFSNASAGFYLLLLTVVFLFSHVKDKYIYTGISAVLALCFIGLLVFSIRNLKRFYRL